MPTIFQINTSKGGLPKHGQPRAEVNTPGINGDLHRDLEHHGGPERAVCLYSLEHIQTLQAEGHPVFPGAMGENITITGLNWDLMVPGTRLKLGEDVLLEITSYTTPCSHLIPFFLNGEFNRAGQKLHPGWSRVYARVLNNGVIQVGDEVFLNPA
jgi:MOSC domain-containing protein YiiM